VRYIDFVDLKYEPDVSELICEFYLDPQGLSLWEAAGGIAAESSIGTWTDLTTVKPYINRLKATVFQIEGNNCKIAYPAELFEPGNMPNILSSVAGNVFGLDALQHLRLNDIHFPEKLVNSFLGPKYGVEGVRNITEIKGRPLVGTIIKPKLGLNTVDHAKVAYNSWLGGCDIVKDDENLSNQAFNPFEDRVIKTLEARDKAEEETGEKKVYLINITASSDELLRRADFVKENSGRYAMIDIITCGFSTLHQLREQDTGLLIHAHRAGHAAFTRSTQHGINMRVIAKVSRLLGVDQLHVGTAVGKMSETREEVEANIKALVDRMHGIKPVLPVASGGLHPGMVPDLMDIFGKDFIMQAGGGIHGHPEGTVKGAVAMRQAVSSVLKGIDINDYAKDHKELDLALKTWSGI